MIEWSEGLQDAVEPGKEAIFIESLPKEQAVRNDAAQTRQVADGEPKRFFIESKRNGISAQCDVYSAKKIVILAGSAANKREIKGSPSSQSLVERLIASGVMVDEGGQYKFNRNYECKSPSMAASIILGMAANGRKELKDENGIAFDNHYPR